MTTQRDVVLIALTLCLAAGCAHHGDGGYTASAPEMPDELRVTGTPVLRVHAVGDQIYTWQADAAGKGAWKLKAPDATFDGEGVKGRHYAGPTWEAITDGSKVVARKVAEHASPTPNAVPWLLLQEVKHDGQGVMSGVTFIQRIKTVGGKAPEEAGKPGDEKRVAYTADYVFYGPGATTRPIQAGSAK
jgi:hypothetical protein